MKPKYYYKVKLVDGTVSDFNKKCSKVTYNDGKYVVFCRTIPGEGDYILALIPHESIFSIIKEEE